MKDKDILKEIERWAKWAKCPVYLSPWIKGERFFYIPSERTPYIEGSKLVKPAKEVRKVKMTSEKICGHCKHFYKCKTNQKTRYNDPACDNYEERKSGEKEVVVETSAVISSSLILIHHRKGHSEMSLKNSGYLTGGYQK